jgi:hypothetical protein
MLKKLVRLLRERTGERVAILIDEYDAPSIRRWTTSGWRS